ncbi:MAG: hypothetical protein HYV67_03290 [Candidatus Taylorbacteria bacterium]|nr:hypothetical protein [Candidatus Taylorbacteria bacterium]
MKPRHQRSNGPPERTVRHGRGSRFARQGMRLFATRARPGIGAACLPSGRGYYPQATRVLVGG